MGEANGEEGSMGNTILKGRNQIMRPIQLALIGCFALLACVSSRDANPRRPPAGSGAAQVVAAPANLPETSEVASANERTFAPPPGDAAPPPVVVPWGTVGREGGTVQRLFFGLTGDTRPGACDDTEHYPAETIAQISRSMKALHVQFGLDLGDHMYVCNGSAEEARIQMDEYMAAIAQGPSTFWMTMGNHECGHLYHFGPCFPGDDDANFIAYMKALGRPHAFYATDIHTALGLARFVFVADDSWDTLQATWLERVLTDADINARYTIVARHHPMDGDRNGPEQVIRMILRHKYSLLLTAHLHTYEHNPSSLDGRTVIVGVGGGPSQSPPGFATVLQNKDATLSFVMRDINGNPVGEPWTVPPQ